MILIYVAVLILSSFGIIGNSAIIYIFPKLKKISNRKSITLLASFDILSILPSIAYAAMMIRGFDIYLISPLSCIILQYYSYVMPIFSVWTLTDISIQRTLTIKKINQNNILIYLRVIVAVIILGSNSMVFQLVGLAQVKVNNQTNLTVTICTHFDKIGEIATTTLYVVLLLIIPAIIITVCSIIMIKQIKNLIQMNLILNQSKFNKSRIKKENKISLTILLLNLGFIVFNSPFCVVIFLFDHTDFWYKFTYLVGFIQFNFNFILYILIYKDFRDYVSYLFLDQT